MTYVDIRREETHRLTNSAIDAMVRDACIQRYGKDISKITRTPEVEIEIHKKLYELHYHQFKPGYKFPIKDVSDSLDRQLKPKN